MIYYLFVFKCLWEDCIFPVKVFKTLTDRQSCLFCTFHKSKKPANLNYHMLMKKSQTILKRFIGLKFSVWFTLRAQKTKPCFVTLTTFFRSTAGQDFQNTKWPAVGKRKEERGKRKEERGKRKEEGGRRKEERGRESWKKFQVSVNMVSFSEPSVNQTGPNAKLDYRAFQDRLTFLNRRMID